MTRTTASIIIGAVIIAGAIVFWAGSSPGSAGTGAGGSRDNVSMSDGKQIIKILAKGGYSPKVTIAKAGVPTIIRVNTQGTFDCSMALVIPSIQYRQNLQPTESLDVPIPPQEAGTSIQGLCAMGMYNFKVNFE